MPSPDDAPVRKKRAAHRIVYTPELLAELRRLYEQTPTSCENIATANGISRPTLRQKAKRERWVRFRRPALDLSPAVKLDARLAEAEASLSRPPDPSPPLVSPTGGGEKDFESRFRLSVSAALDEVHEQIAAVKTARLQMQETGRVALAAQLGRDLNAMTNSLYRIKRMYGGETDGAQIDDDNVTDLDARRDALARRIETILAEWTDAESAGQAAGE